MNSVSGNRGFAEIHLGALEHNVQQLKSITSSQLMVVVKADAYGHGAVPVSLAARSAGADWLGVAYVDEALELRKNNVPGPILAWLLHHDDNFEEALSVDIDLSIATIEQLQRINQMAKKLNLVASIHLEIDTGLSRSGVALNDLESMYSEIRNAEHCKLVSIWSHLASSEDRAHIANQRQVKNFEIALQRADEMGISYDFVHIANSAATLLDSNLHFGMVRCGIATYGVTPGGDVGEIRHHNLKPVMRVLSEVAQVRRLQSGDGVSYNHTWVASKPTTVGLIPIGYADGIPRNAGNKSKVTFQGKQYPIVGTVCMDQFVVDFGDDEINVGDVVEIFGVAIDAHTFNQVAGGIGYELVTRIGQRLEKRYVDSHEPI